MRYPPFKFSLTGCKKKKKATSGKETKHASKSNLNSLFI